MLIWSCRSSNVGPGTAMHSPYKMKKYGTYVNNFKQHGMINTFLTSAYLPKTDANKSVGDLIYK